MSDGRTNEQVIEIASDGVLFLMEGIGELLGKSKMTDFEKNSIFSKLQSLMSEFLKNPKFQSYGEIPLEQLQSLNSELEKVDLAQDHIPEFQKLAKEYQLAYSVSAVKTDNDIDITVLKFPKADIDKMTKICMAIAKKSIDKSKEPIKEKLSKAKQKSNEQQQSKEKTKEKQVER